MAHKNCVSENQVPNFNWLMINFQTKIAIWIHLGGIYMYIYICVCVWIYGTVYPIFKYTHMSRTNDDVGFSNAQRIIFWLNYM